ncbi:MAG: methyltransferase domain-containing protein [Acidobacteriota bacterium]
MSLLVPPRRPSRERLDDPDLPCVEMRRNMEDLRLVNQHWGGARALGLYLRTRIAALPDRPVRILDVGAGSGEVASRLQQALRDARCRATVVALDLQWRHLRAGRLMPHRPPAAVAADAFRLPFACGAFDFAVSTLFFHHFSPEENRDLLREMSRVARHGFALMDLRRHVFPALFVSLAGRMLFQSRISVQDGVASVRQAYTPEEALGIAQAAASASRARRVFPFRWLLTGGP